MIIPKKIAWKTAFRVFVLFWLLPFFLLLLQALLEFFWSGNPFFLSTGYSFSYARWLLINFVPLTILIFWSNAQIKKISTAVLVQVDAIYSLLLLVVMTLFQYDIFSLWSENLSHPNRLDVHIFQQGIENFNQSYPKFIFLQSLAMALLYFLYLSVDIRKKRVFISYSRQDYSQSEQLRKFLEIEGFTVVMDNQDFQLSHKVKEEIMKSIRTTHFTIALISKASLRSPWVIMEAAASLSHERVLQQVRFFALVLDDVLQQDQLSMVIINEIDQKIAEAKESSISEEAFQSRKRLLEEQKRNLNDVLEKLTMAIYQDASTAEKFEAALLMLSKSLKNRTVLKSEIYQKNH